MQQHPKKCIYRYSMHACSLSYSNLWPSNSDIIWSVNSQGPTEQISAALRRTTVCQLTSSGLCLEGFLEIHKQTSLRTDQQLSLSLLAMPPDPPRGAASAPFAITSAFRKQSQITRNTPALILLLHRQRINRLTTLPFTGTDIGNTRLLLTQRKLQRDFLNKKYLLAICNFKKSKKTFAWHNVVVEVLGWLQLEN